MIVWYFSLPWIFFLGPPPLFPALTPHTIATIIRPAHNNNSFAISTYAIFDMQMNNNNNQNNQAISVNTGFERSPQQKPFNFFFFSTAISLALTGNFFALPSYSHVFSDLLKTVSPPPRNDRKRKIESDINGRPNTSPRTPVHRSPHAPGLRLQFFLFSTRKSN